MVCSCGDDRYASTMKEILYLATTVFVVAACAFHRIPGVFASHSGDDDNDSVVSERYGIEPRGADYDTAAQTFEFRYRVHEDVVPGDIGASVWDGNCAEGGNELTPATPGISGVGTSLDGDRSEVRFAVTVDLSALRDDDDNNNTGVFTHLPAQQLAELRICARMSLHTTFMGRTREMNILETVAEVEFDVSTGGFEVEDFRVGPKDRETAARAGVYDCIGYLCDRDDPAVDLTDTAGAGAVLYHQGALISVCVTPTRDALEDGVVMESIREFTWRRHGGGPVHLEQAAIRDGAPAPNHLSVLDCLPGSVICVISSVLYSGYYRVPLPEGNYVEGSGTAHMMLDPNRNRRSRRRLERDGRRRLQNGDGAIRETGFDLRVRNVIAEDDDEYRPIRAAGAGKARTGGRDGHRRRLLLLLVPGVLVGSAILWA